MWQDTFITATNIIFALNLLPQLRDVIRTKKPMNLWTCSLTFILLCGVNVTMATLGLWLSALPQCTIVWGLLLYFSWKYRRN